MLFNYVRYEDPGPISIPTKIQTYTPNNKEITVWGIRHASPPPSPPFNVAPKKGLAWMGLKDVCSCRL